MNSFRRKRSAVQSSSMATARTVSNPSFFSDAHPVSRLKSQVYFFDVPLGYANHTMTSPLARFAISGASFSTSLLRVTNASQNPASATDSRWWWIVITVSLASSGRKLSGASSTTISCRLLRLSFSNTIHIISHATRSRELICKSPQIIFLEMEPVLRLRRNHARIVVMEPSDGDRVIQQHAVVGHIDRCYRQLTSLAERVADRRIERDVHRQIRPVVRPLMRPGQHVREPRAVVHIARKPCAHGQVRGEARVQRVALVVVKRDVLRSQVARRVARDTARKTADDISTLLRDLVGVGHIKLPISPQRRRMQRHLPRADQRSIHRDWEIHVRFAQVRVVEKVVHAILEGIDIQHPSPVRNLDAELVLFVAF